MITIADARNRALCKGATSEEIEAEIVRQRRERGTVPFNNMIRALQMHTWNNDKADWIRLTAALTVKYERRA
jgi:hypothetical protein